MTAPLGCGLAPEALMVGSDAVGDGKDTRSGVFICGSNIFSMFFNKDEKSAVPAGPAVTFGPAAPLLPVSVILTGGCV